jgi:PAS domain S-box-containing protein
MNHANMMDSANTKDAQNESLATGENVRGVTPLIAESWARCRALGYDPKLAPAIALVEPEDLERRVARNRDLLTVALPILDELQALVQDLGFLTLLTDSDGVILKMLSGPMLRDAGSEGNLSLGGIWREEQAGTGAIGLVLRMGQPVQVVGTEHFFERDHDLTCSAAPIFNHDNRLLGILNVSGPRQEAHLHTLGIVVVASMAITNQLRVEEDHRQIWLANEYLRTVINSVSDGIVAIDSNGFIKEINSEAANILATDSLFARGKDIQIFVGKQPLFRKVLTDGKPVTDMETTMETRRGYAQCHISAKPIRRADGQVVGVVATLKEMKKLQRVVNQITGAEARFNFANILGESSSMQRAIHLAQVAARNMHTVLIQGESGTGKELFAQAIHNASITGQPFIALNCAAIPETLIESELFGYEGGSFTGANRNGRPGKFELANDGTIFLDEIGEMPLNIQAVLLRVLQERSVVRIGGHRPTPINVRVIAATSKDLAIEVPKGNFRQDLFYRLNVFEIRIPPLRERSGDIAGLVDHLVRTFSARYGKSVTGVSLPVLKRLCTYHWPGNVRQLENVVERAISLVDGEIIEEQHLPDFLFAEPHRPIDEFSFDGRTANIDGVEKEAILEAVRHFGERQQAARSLGISRSTLYRRLKRYRVDSAD